MANQAFPAKLQPCLIDRLTDEHPDQNLEGQQGISLSRYREGFLRDLRWLLNAKCHVEGEGLEDFPEVAQSVFNFGMPDPAGRSIISEDYSMIEQQIHAAILRFEPRILPGSLEVHAVEEFNKAAPNTIGFEITGTLWAMPMHEPFHVKTQMDLENGQCSF
jgi:type VI secretion system protein ImpF